MTGRGRFLPGTPDGSDSLFDSPAFEGAEAGRIPPGPRKSVLTVSELNRRARGLLEASLELMWVTGELSNVVRAASGHWYFVLKDDAAQVRCVMFRNKAAGVGFAPQNGMQVEVNALPSLYEARGEFQLGVETMRRAGLGALYEAFLKLKAKLEGEGLFDPDSKRDLPAFPARIGVVTSLKAAALRDVLTTLRRRAPMIEVIVYPTAVQGAGAAAEIVAALDLAARRNEVDALIVCRGGGSIEDLWPFNEESVARAIAASPLTVVSGVGHETDFTIADFVADRRAPTPTAAAELLSPNREDLLAGLRQHAWRMQRGMRHRLDMAGQRLDGARRGLLSPAEQLGLARDRLARLRTALDRAATSAITERRWQLTHAAERLHGRRPDLNSHQDGLANIRKALMQSMSRRVQSARLETDQWRARLDLLDPQRTLERGYAIATLQDGGVVRDAAQLARGTPVRLRLASGGANVTVDDTMPT
ncbi:MAG: exodeoxyribonuclease VII large subunit [Burkholderiales bacterium]|nr:exodeoxyribonuclease VII large subunit [Burkholderiales bacterium]